MPFYTYVCSAGHKHDEIRSVALRNRPSRCPLKECRRKARRQIIQSSVTIVPDVPDHWNPTIGSGRRVKSRQHLKKLQAEHGCEDFDPIAAKPSTGWQG